MYDDNKIDAQSILFNYKSLSLFKEQLNYVLLIIYSLDHETRKQFDPEMRKFEAVFLDLGFKRKVERRDGLVKEYPVEYFGKDYGHDDPFQFDELTEEKITEYQLELMGIIGRIISLMQEDVISLDGEM